MHKNFTHKVQNGFEGNGAWCVTNSGYAPRTTHHGSRVYEQVVIERVIRNL